VIQIDGLEYKVSPNVYSILRGKRSTNHNVILWIDSICINQEDGEEKSTQVALMRRIFEEASSTIAWIGDVDSTDAKLAIGLLGKFDVLETIPKLRKGFSSLEQREWNAFWTMVSSSWFERGWIVQEIAVATRPVLRYGSEIPWERFAQAIISISAFGIENLILYLYPYQKSGRLEPGSGLMNAIIMEYLRLACMNEDYLSLKDMLKVGLMFNATLPVDKVYALLGIVAERGIIHPDYSRTGAKKTKEQIVVEAQNDMQRLMERPTELFAYLSGHTQQYSRKVCNTIRSATNTLKYTIQFAGDMFALLEKLTPEGQESD